MNILLHSIALEPARWTPARVSCKLADLLAPIANAGFDRLEIFEPHLDADAAEIRDGFCRHGLQPLILSSYLNLNPAETPDADLSAKLDVLAERIQFFGFQKLRLFAGSRMSPQDTEGIAVFTERIRALAKRFSETEVLLETHDGSLADDPRVIVRIVEEVALPNVGLLYQPTVFTAESALEQLALQKHLIRHVHLQNRNPDLSFATLKDGVIPWKSILAELPPAVEATLEFVACGICSVESFDLEATIAEAKADVAYIREITTVA